MSSPKASVSSHRFFVDRNVNVDIVEDSLEEKVIRDFGEVYLIEMTQMTFRIVGFYYPNNNSME